MDEKRAHSRTLMHEVAVDAAAIPIVLLDISLHSISFASSAEMLTGGSYALRFTLPGSPRLHFVLVKIVVRTGENVPAGFRYGAKIERIDSKTVDHIIEFLSQPA